LQTQSIFKWFSADLHPKKRHFPAVVGHALKALITFVAYGHVFYLLYMLGLMTASMKSILLKKISMENGVFFTHQ
jgi:hypothetical protein